MTHVDPPPVAWPGSWEPLGVTADDGGVNVAIWAEGAERVEFCLIADDGIDEAFEDVPGLFAHCRFSDCAHDREPGCAVQAALEDGTLPAERWDSYLKLQGELEHLERKLDKRAAAEARRAVTDQSPDRINR